MASSTCCCRLVVVLAFIFSATWNCADPFQLDASSYPTAGTSYPSIGHNDPTRTTVIRRSTAPTSYTTPPPSIRSTSRTTAAGKLQSVSSSGKMKTCRPTPAAIGFASYFTLSPAYKMLDSPVFSKFITIFCVTTVGIL